MNAWDKSGAIPKGSKGLYHRLLLDMRQLSKHCKSQQISMWTMPSLGRVGSVLL